MIVLTETTDNLQIVLGGSVTTNQLRCFACYRDITTTAYTPARTVTNTNNTTDVNIVPAPASSTQRVVDYLSVYNSDTVSATVTIKFDANGTEYVLFKAILSTGERLDYAEGQGFNVYDLKGAKKVLNAVGSVLNTDWNIVTIGSDVVNNNAVANTIADITGLEFAIVSGNTYYFEFLIKYDSAATTTGARFSITGPSITSLYYRSTYPTSATAETTNTASAYDVPSGSNTGSLTTGNVANIWGFITPSADGDLTGRFASEVSSSAVTVKAGSFVRWILIS